MKKNTLWRTLITLPLLISLVGCVSLFKQIQMNKINSIEELPEGYRIVTGKFNVEPMAEHYHKAMTWIYYPSINGVVDQSIKPMLAARNSMWNESFYTSLKDGDSYYIRLPSITWSTFRTVNSYRNVQTTHSIDFGWIEVTFPKDTKNLYIGEIVIVTTGVDTFELRVDDSYNYSNSAFKAKFGVEEDLGKANIRIISEDELEEIRQKY